MMHSFSIACRELMFVALTCKLCIHQCNFQISHVKCSHVNESYVKPSHENNSNVMCSYEKNSEVLSSHVKCSHDNDSYVKQSNNSFVCPKFTREVFTQIKNIHIAKKYITTFPYKQLKCEQYPYEQLMNEYIKSTREIKYSCHRDFSYKQFICEFACTQLMHRQFKYRQLK